MLFRLALYNGVVEADLTESMTPKSGPYKVISLFIKLAILCGCVYYIYYKIFERSNFSSIKDEFAKMNLQLTAWMLVLIFILMFFNWSLEAMKWKLIVRQLQPLSFWESLKSVFTGVTASLLTPNRVGEFSGRIFFLSEGNRARAVLLTFLGSTAQLLVTIVTAGIALIFYLPGYSNFNWQMNLFGMLLILFSALILCAGLLVVYFKINWLASFTGKGKRLSKIHKYLSVLNGFSITELAQILFLSTVRYIVFTIQFYMLLRLFGVAIGFAEGCMMIVLTFFTITFVPTIGLSELGVRGTASLAFVGLLSTNNIGILAATLLLWIINIAIPAVLGSVFAFRLNFFKVQHGH